MIAARITDGVTSELARVPELSVVSRTTAARFASEAQPIRDAAQALDAALVMEGSVVVEAGGIHAVMRIVDAALDRKVWVGEYDSPPGSGGVAAAADRVGSVGRDSHALPGALSASAASPDLPTGGV